jgi:uncharacterized protein YkwD
VSPIVQRRGLIAIAVCVALYALSTRLPLNAAAGSRTVTRAYDDVGCGSVRDVGWNITGPAGKAMTLCLLNVERARGGLSPLVESGLLDRAAERHSADMIARRFFEHVNPDGVPPENRMAAAGYTLIPGTTTGENIAWGDGGLASPAAIVDSWMHSPEHRENILRPAFREVGIGVSLGNRPTAARDTRRAATYTTDFGS